MYSILIRPESNSPFVISQNAFAYVEYIDAGYEQIATGTRKEMYSILDECVTAYTD